jgi:hypothetical protein
MLVQINLKAYKAYPRPIKELFTMLCIHEVLASKHADSCAALVRIWQRELESKRKLTDGFERKQLRFLYRGLSGTPLRNQVKFNEIEGFSSCASQLLQHPFWFVMSISSSALCHPAARYYEIPLHFLRKKKSQYLDMTKSSYAYPENKSLLFENDELTELTKALMMFYEAARLEQRDRMTIALLNTKYHYLNIISKLRYSKTAWRLRCILLAKINRIEKLAGVELDKTFLCIELSEKKFTAQHQNSAHLSFVETNNSIFH